MIIVNNTGHNHLRLNILIPFQICLHLMKILQMPLPNMMPHNAQKHVLIVCAFRHLFAEINVTVLRTLGAEIL